MFVIFQRFLKTKIKTFLQVNKMCNLKVLKGCKYNLNSQDN